MGRRLLPLLVAMSLSCGGCADQDSPITQAVEDRGGARDAGDTSPPGA